MVDGCYHSTASLWTRRIRGSVSLLAVSHRRPLRRRAAAVPPCSCLISDDQGSVWRVGGNVSISHTWLTENSLCETVPGRLLMLFTSGAGAIFASQSQDGGESWSDPSPTPLPNPNSKVGATGLPSRGAGRGQALALAYNPSTTACAPLHLALSTDDGRSFCDVAVLEDKPTGSFACPTPINGGLEGEGDPDFAGLRHEDMPRQRVFIGYSCVEGMRMAVVTLGSEAEGSAGSG